MDRMPIENQLVMLNLIFTNHAYLSIKKERAKQVSPFSIESP